MNEFREFTQTDWYGWAGAEPFAGGQPPLICEVDLTEDGRSAVILLDRNGIEVDFFSEEVDDAEVWSMDESNRMLARLIAEGLDLANANLEELGFKKIS